MKKSEIKAIVFDIGGVLAIPRKPTIAKKGRSQEGLIVSGVFNYAAKKFKISVDQLLDSMDSIYAKSIVGEINEEKVLAEISKNLKMPQRKVRRIFLKAYERKFKHNKELYKTAFKLRKKGYKIAILSDQWHISERVVAPKRYMKKFDVVIISTSARIRKPDPKIYRLVLRKLKLAAKKTVFIDNRDWNIKHAKKLGIKTILFKENKQTFKELKKLGVKLNE